jgi:hypothetical protein
MARVKLTVRITVNNRIDVTYIQRGWVAVANQLVDKRAQATCTLEALGVVDAQGWHGFPERAPALGEDAGPHGLAGKQERHQVLEEVVR